MHNNDINNRNKKYELLETLRLKPSWQRPGSSPMNWATTSGCSEYYIILWAFVTGNFSHCTGQGEHLGSGGYNKSDSRVSKIYQISHFATCYLVRPKIAFAYPLFFSFLIISGTTSTPAMVETTVQDRMSTAARAPA